MNVKHVNKCTGATIVMCFAICVDLVSMALLSLGVAGLSLYERIAFHIGLCTVISSRKSYHCAAHIVIVKGQN